MHLIKFNMKDKSIHRMTIDMQVERGKANDIN